VGRVRKTPNAWEGVDFAVRPREPSTFEQRKKAMSRIEFKQARIAKRVFNTSDEEVLDQVKAVLDLQSGDWWKNLPARVRKDVELSLAQADEGETVSHADAMKQIRAWRRR